jgi:hypothetical protein
MECSTKRIDKDGNLIEKPKKQFNTLDAAIKHCKEENVRDDRTEKVAPYKCTVCCKYHVGRNGSIIKEKEKIKLRKELEPRLKIVGKIDSDAIWKRK